VQANQEWVVSIAKAAASIGAAGIALIGMGSALQVVAFGVGGFAKALAVATSPLRGLLAIAAVIAKSFSTVTAGVTMLAAPMVRAGAAFVTFAAQAGAAAIAATASMVAMAANSARAAAYVGAVWAGQAVAGLAAFAATAKAYLTYYTGTLAFVTANTIARAGAIAGAYLTTGLTGVITFVSQAVAGLAVYVGATAAAAASTLSSTAAMAAAWIAPVAPIIALGAAIYGVGTALVSAFSQSGSVASSIGSLFEPMSAGFSQMLEDGKKVFSDLWGTATLTFNGISDAITAGDMSKAFDVLWAGLSASWLRGQQAVMGYVDQFVEYLQNRWGDAVTWIAKAMTRGLGMIQRAWINTTGLLFQAFQMSINKVMDVWDTAIGAIQKAIAYIRSFFDKSIDYDAIKKQIDAANAERKKDRDKDVAASRQATDKKVEDQKRAEEEAIGFIDRENQQAQDDRAARSAKNAEQRQTQVDAANQNVRNERGLAGGARQSSELLKGIAEATTPDELRDLLDEARALHETGRISAERLAEIEGRIDDQTAEIDKTRAMQAQEQQKAAADAAAADAAAKGVSQEKDKVSTAGTFSAYAATFLGNGSTVAERTAKAAEETAKNTRKIGAGSVQP
jgi:hypothetical protein